MSAIEIARMVMVQADGEEPEQRGGEDDPRVAITAGGLVLPAIAPQQRPRNDRDLFGARQASTTKSPA